jgi:DNA (cytosine-5)-methyltransferase 1
MRKSTKKIEAIDLFCGVGGLTCGLSHAGIIVKAGYDIDPACRYPYEANSKAVFVEKSVAELTGTELSKYWSKGCVRLLAGCAPCQPFSSIATNSSAKGRHEKWGMLFHFARLVREALPDLVTMENVPGVIGEEPFEEFIQTLTDCGFHVEYDIVDAANFGAPQRRRRLVLIASRIGETRLPEPTHPGPEHWITVRKAIGHLPAINAGEASNSDPLHKAANLSETNKQRILSSKEGGTWRDWPEELRADCHKRDSGKHSAGVYGRMNWDRPAPTMTTLCYGYGNGRFGHPEQHRAISLREAAIFQSFPEDYQFAPKGEKVAMKNVSRMIGNAVPPKLGEAVGRALSGIKRQ